MSECNFADDQPALNLRNTHLDPSQKRFDSMDGQPGDPWQFTSRAAVQDARRSIYGYEREGGES